MDKLEYQVKQDKTTDKWYVTIWNGDRIVTDFGEYPDREAAVAGANGDSNERQDCDAPFKGSSKLVLPIDTVLQNKAEIISEMKTKHGEHIVLCRDTLGNWVTWKLGPTTRPDGKLPAYMGAYFPNDEMGARANFIERCAAALGVRS